MTADPPVYIEEADHLLAQAARMDLATMRHTHELVLDSADAKVVGTLVHAYSRASRCMRQNLALLARQKAERAKAERDAARPPPPEPRKTPQEMAWEARADGLQEAVGRIISAAAAGDTALHADWNHRFERELEDWYEADDFLDEHPQTQIRRACATLGLPEHLAETWQDLPEPTYFPDPEPQAAEDPAQAAQPPPEPDAISPDDPDAPDVPVTNSG